MEEYFIDMHSHILPEVDDGAQNIEEMKKMLAIAYKEGIRCIIATPHHHPHRGKASPATLRKQVDVLRQAAHEIDEKFRIYLGTEIYYNQDVVQDLREEKILTMNRRNYVLVEFSPSQNFRNIRLGIQQLQLAGYQVILAHVERYYCIVEHPEFAEELCDMGTYLQVNAGSITGDYGRAASKFVDKLLKDNMVYCVGTDAHDTKKRPPKMKKAAAHVKKKYGEAYAHQIFYTNAKEMLKKRV